MIFNDAELFELADRGQGGTARARSFPFTKSLNALWRSGRSPVFRAEPAGSGARILADGQSILEVLPGDAPHPLEAAQRWTGMIEGLFRQSRGRQP